MLYFKNWSTEDFTWNWDGNPTTVKKGEIKGMEDYLANHMARHLTDRELQKAGLNLVCTERDEYYARCFAEVDVKETITEKQEEKVQVKETAKVPSGNIDPEEFADLKKKNAPTVKKGSKK